MEFQCVKRGRQLFTLFLVVEVVSLRQSSFALEFTFGIVPRAILNTFRPNITVRAQELCDSRGGRPGLPRP